MVDCLFLSLYFWMLGALLYLTNALHTTGCSLNIVFFSENFKIFRSLVFLSSPSVYTHKAGRKTSAAAELAEFRKIQNFKEKTQYLMNTLYLTL